MIDYKIALNITYYSALILAYMILVTVVGYFRALVSKWAGDDTAEQQGFLTLNPLVHIDFFGLSVLIIVYYYFGMLVGWGQRVPINPSFIQGPYRWLKISAAMLSGAVAYCALVLLGDALSLVYNCSLATSFDNNILSVEALFELLRSLCIFLAFIELIINLFRLASLIDRSRSFGHKIFYILLSAPLVLIIMIWFLNLAWIMSEGFYYCMKQALSCLGIF